MNAIMTWGGEISGDESTKSVDRASHARKLFSAVTRHARGLCYRFGNAQSIGLFSGIAYIKPQSRMKYGNGISGPCDEFGPSFLDLRRTTRDGRRPIAVGKLWNASSISTLTQSRTILNPDRGTLHILGKPEEPGPQERVIELYDTLRRPLHAYLSTFGLNPDKADDVIQETFVRLMRHLTAIDNGTRSETLQEENHRGWLFRVAHNIAMDVYRDAERAPHLSRDDRDLLLPESIDPALDPEQSILLDERLNRLDEAVSGLNPQQRSCLLLRAEGLRYREIASVLGVSTPRVRAILERSMARLMGVL